MNGSTVNTILCIRPHKGFLQNKSLPVLLLAFIEYWFSFGYPCTKWSSI